VVDLSQAAAWHRQVAALAAAADRAGVAADELPAVRARVLAQQVRLTEAAARSGRATPVLVPSPAEISAAAPALGDLSPAAVAEALRTGLSTLDSVDAALAPPASSTPPPPSLPPPGPPGWPVGVRNAFVYGGFAVTVLAIQLVLLATVDEERSLPLLAPFCLIVLPAFAWAAGWFTIGVVFRSPPGSPPLKRTPRVGAVVCLAPNLVLCAGLGLLYLIR
jgi:hypothetical protein